MTSIVIAADVGGLDGYHVGDEAMLAANLAILRRLRPDAVFTTISRDPEWTAAHYGVRALPVLGFGSSPEQRCQLECEVLEQAEQFRATGSVTPSKAGAIVVDALARADAFIVSGAGNLCSRWPEQIHDRTVLIRAARILDKPVVILGQTIGPPLDDEGRERLAQALPLASLVGVRGRESAELAQSLGVCSSKLVEQLDDAWFLSPSPSPAVARAAAELRRPWVAVTLAPMAGDAANFLPILRSLGRQFSELARTIDAELVFLPHWNALPGCESDALLARRLYGFLDEPQRARLLPIYTAEDTCWLTRQADLVVTTRYHPIVFALSGGVPCVAISTDEHTRVRHVECLRQAGLDHLAISFEAALGGGLVPAAISAWDQRDATRRQLDSHAVEWTESEARKWSRVRQVLGWPDQDVAQPGFEGRVPASPSLQDEPASLTPVPNTRRHARSTTDVSAVVLTKNGSDRLERCLQSIAEAGIARELVVLVDQATTDETESIARRFTSRVLRVNTRGCIELSLSEMAAACSGEFVLRIDDDETLGGQWDFPVGDTAFTHFLVPRRWLTPGEDYFISSGEWFPDLQLRLFRNEPSLIRWPSDIHEHMVVQGAGVVLWDRWIDHHVLWQQTRAAREQKCTAYQSTRPEKHLSHFYLWEEQAVRLSRCGSKGASAAEPLGNGAEVLFGSDGTAAPYMLDGWSHAEPWGTWTDGDHAVLRLPLTRVPRGPVEVALEANAFIRPGHPELRVSVSCERTVVAEWVIRTSDVATYTASIPEQLTAEQGALVLSLNIENPTSPRELGESADARRIGLGVRRLRLDWR